MTPAADLPTEPASAPDSRVLDSLAGIAAEDWNDLAGDNPTLSHAWLHSLHESGSACAETGWIPQYLSLWRQNVLAGAMPLYVKLHSYGEYVFDWAWADAYERSGLPYFPKLLSAVPFTPCTGARLLARHAADRQALLALALEAARSSEVSSLHILFPHDAEIELMAGQGLLRRTTIQFHWRNAGYPSFEAYLAAMSHDKRKRIRQERRKVSEAGVRFRRVTGADIREQDWDFFHACYVRTYREHRSTPYLNRDFFRLIASRMPDNLLMVIGEREGTPVCSALNLYNRHTLYGRYWGSLGFLNGLHFEACYYQAIEFCIERGIQLFEGGAQGAHKLARGFLPSRTGSVHWLREPRFARAVEDYLRRETGGIEATLDELELSSPFKAGS